MSGTEAGAARPAAAIIPRPLAVSATAAPPFALTEATVLDADQHSTAVASWLRAALAAATGFAFRDGTGPHGAITLRVTASAPAEADLGPEGYRLEAASTGVRLEAADSAGLFYAAQTLLGLLPPEVYRRAAITDRPRLRWRGALLDVARHFLPKHDVLRFIDLLAMHKLNVLHLHLTDDQGWRVEIRRHPRLTEVGAWRRQSALGDRRHNLFDGRPHGGYYTQDDIREIVAYAAARHVTVVPEVDVPGHAGAAIAAYPHLGNTDSPGHPAAPQVATHWGILDNVLSAEESTLQFVREVFDEVMDLFPSRYICVGGDECPTGPWESSPRAQARIAQLALPDADGLRSWFVARLAEHLAARGRVLYGWDEICDGDLPPGAVIASWRGTAGAITAARRGHEVVLCPDDQVYLDWRQSDHPGEPTPIGKVLSLAHVYAFDPVPAELSESEVERVLGAQANIWTEHLDCARGIDYMAFPRLAAFAETVWSRAADRDFAEFEPRLRRHEQRLEAAGVEYRRASGPLPWQSRPDAPGWPR